MASRSLGSLTLDLVARIGGFTGPLDKAARDLDKRTRDMQRSMSAVTGSIKTLGANIAGFFVGIAAGVVSLDAFFGAINHLDRLDELSAKTGISTEQLSKFGYAAKLTGTDLEELNGAFDKLAKSAVAALNPTSKQAEVFAALGVSVKDAQGNLKTTDVLIGEVATAFKDLKDDTLEAATAQALFGKSGAGLLEFLNLGAAGLDEMGQKASDLGAVFDAETTKAAADLKDEFDNLKTVIGGLLVDVLKPLIPVLRDTALELQGVAKESRGAGGDAAKAGEGLAQLFTSVKTLGTGSITVLEQMREVLNGLQDQAVGYTNLILGRAGALQQIRASGDRIAGALSGPKGPMDTSFPSYLDAPQYLSGEKDFRVTDGRFSIVPKSAIVDAQALAKAVSGEADAEAKKTKAKRESNKETEAEKKFREEILEVNEMIAELERDSQADIFQNNQRRQDDLDAILSDLEFEKSLLGQTADEQERLNLLRYAGVDAATAEGKAIEDSLKALQDRRAVMEDQITAMDALRDAGKGFLTDLREGVSLGHALKDAFDSLLDAIYDAVVENIIGQLFGQMGSTGGGSAGGWLSQLAGSFFGGGRASGGAVSPGTLYRVNEYRPEMLTVGGRDYLMMGANAGHVTPNARGAGTSVTVQNTYINPQMADARSESQRQQREAELLRTAQRNS